MLYLLVKLTRLFGVILVLLIVGTRTLSSSALLFRDQLCLPNPAPYSQVWGRHNGRMKASYDVTDAIGTSAESKVKRSGRSFSGEQNDGDNINANSILTFRSSFERQSNPFVHLPSNVKLDEFLLHSDHLLDAGKSVHSKIVPKTTKLFEEWTIACDHVGASPPNVDNGVITAVRTAGISIPGITIEWSALIGINLVYRSHVHHDQHQYPELQFVLIKDENKASGAKPIVWIFNKLTRKRNKSLRGRSEFRPSCTDTKLFTRLAFYNERSLPVTCGGQGIGNNMSESLFIRSTGTMEMRFGIPSVVRTLFLSSDGDTQKAEAERRISNIITRQIEKDAEQNILRWEENFKAWTNSINERTKGE